MNKENKFLLIIQIVVSIAIAIFIIQQPWKLEFTNPNTGENIGVFASILYFGLIFWMFGTVWGAGLFVCVVERLFNIKKNILFLN